MAEQRPQQAPGARTNAEMIDDYSDPTTNEGNLLSLITLKQIVGSADGKSPYDDVIKSMAAEETRHLMLAMAILSEDGSGKLAKAAPAAQKLQDKFGRDMAGAVRLGKLLKTQADAKEVELMMEPFVRATLFKKGKSRNIRSGFNMDQEGKDYTGDQIKMELGHATDTLYPLRS